MDKVFTLTAGRMVRIIIVVAALLLTAVRGWGKDNFVMSGRLDGVDKDVLLIEYISFEPDRKMVRKRVPVRDGYFEFSASLKNAWLARIRLKSVPEKDNKGFSIFLVPDETLVLRGDLRREQELYKVKVGGSEYYEDLAKVREFVRPFQEELAAAVMEYNDGLASGGDRVALLRGRQKSEQQINDRYRAVREAYVMSHPESEAAYSLVQLDDRWGIAAIENLEPEVRGGRFGCKIAQDLKVMQLMSLQRMAAKNRPAALLAQGRQMPPFRLRKPEGGTFPSDSLIGKYTVIDFWGSWCIWCIRGIPRMKKCHERYADRLNIVSIACSDTEEGWRSALKKNRMLWTQVISDDRTVEAAYNVKAYPTKFVIDPDGVVLRSFSGEGEDFYDYLEELLGD